MVSARVKCLSSECFGVAVKPKLLVRVVAVIAAVLPLVLLLQAVGPDPVASATTTYAETTGGVTHTWTNYTNAGGTEGQSIAAYATVQIACRLTGFKVADGNTWWYQIASSPWNDVYYASADAFYNNGQTSGTLKGTPWYDPKVPVCGSNPQGGVNETTGGSTHTWSNPEDAGGTQGPTIGAYATVSIACRLTGFKVADGNTWWYLVGAAPWDSQFYASADAFYNNGQTSGSLIGTPFVDPNVPICSSGNGGGGTPPGTFAETAGGAAHTWSDYSDAGGTQGPTIAAYAQVGVTCKVTGFKVADGNTWWYEVGSSPWSNSYYVSADAFYNNGRTSGSLVGTPFVDPEVPDCSTTGSPKPNTEYAGGPASTWTNYTDAGGEQGTTVSSGEQVTVACRVTGFAVADKNTWWYLLASGPWNNLYYVSADAFYNDGQTSGSLIGTPFVDTNVPICTANQEEPAYGTALGSSRASVSQTRCNSADPVDCASGDFWQTFTDVSIPGRGPALDLTRTYNDLAGATAGIFGYGWSSSYDQHLTFNADGSITVTLADGSQVVAEPNGSGGYTVPAWADSSLAENSNGTYTYTEQATTFLTFAAGSYGTSGSTGGQLVSLSDPNGYTTTLAYNASGQLSSVTDSSGRTIQVSFGPDGLVSSATDPMGRTTSYGYDSTGDLTSVTDPMGRTWAFTYNSSHQMLTMTDPAGNVTTNTYDALGRVTKQTDPAGLATTFAYTGDNFSALGGTTTITDPHGNVEVEQYANGFLAELTKAYGTSAAATWAYTYDPATFGVASVTDPDGNTTSYTYNSTGQVLTRTDPLSNATTYSYNALQEVLTTTDPLGNVTTNTYDANGNLLTTTDPLGNVTSYSYGDGHPGDVTAVTQPDGQVTTVTYDTDGDVASRSVSPSAGVSDTTSYVYDTDGELACQASADAAASGIQCPSAGSAWVAGTTATSYDADGEVTSVTDPDGNSTSYLYDADGNRVEVTDPSGNITDSTYDPDNRLLSTTTGVNGASPATTSHGYDLPPGTGACPSLAGATYCTTTTNPNGGVTVDAYNAANELIQQELPGGQTTSYGYDLAGNKTSTTDADGRTTTYGYDNDYRLTAVSYSDTSTPGVSYGYDADSRRTFMTDGTGTTTYAYDADNRLTSVTNGAGATVGYGYDPSGDVTSISYPGNHQVTRSYNQAGWLASITDWLGNTTTFSYDADGNLSATSYPNGDTVTSTYDPDNNETGTSAESGSGTTLASIQYTRNADSLITQEADSGALNGTTTYTYSAQNQLTSAGPSSYGYDTAGNLTSQPGASQTFNAADELTSSTSGANSVSYSYDAIGDRTSATLPSGTATHYSYNMLGELTSAAQISPVPAVTGISATAGPVKGGTTITITGTGFTGATAVSFGTVPAASYTVVSDTQILATSPAQSAGTVDVTVTTPGGPSAASPADQFSYASVPAVTSISAAAGPVSGGTSVTITGTGFTSVSAVSFGSVPAASYTVVSGTQIMATSPAQSAGTFDVTVATPGGVSATSAADQFTYAPLPTVTAISPAAGATSDGSTVTITGSGFSGASAVSFGSAAAASYTVVSGTQITATTPAQSAGTVDITVTTPGGVSATSAADQFTYALLPTVTAISPAAGATSGGSMVTITGTGFSGASVVSFGSVPAVSYTVVSGTQITATTPAQSAGMVDITVTTPGGQSATSPADQFTYSPAPAITSVTPPSGPLNGGTSVTITGSGFSGASVVSFGSVPAASYSVVSGTQITATTPAQSAGMVDITVTTPGGQSATSPADQFTYQTAPAVTHVAPAAGPVKGGTSVTITGSGFSGASVVSFGSVPAASYTVVSGTQITATSPAQSAGAVDITVATPGGVSTSVPADQFTYAPVPAITKITPAAGPIAGGTAVTITGTGFTATSAVAFGSAQATTFTVVSSTQITATTPAEPAATVTVKITTPGGTSATGSAAKFTYLARPKVTNVSPKTGSTKGGTTVTVTGTGFTDATSLLFGTAPGTGLTVLSATKMTVVTPAHAAGAINITLSTPGGTSAVVTADKFTYKTLKASKRAGSTARIKPALASTTIASYTYNGDGLRATETTGAGNLAFTWDTNQGTPQILSDGNNSYIYGPSGLPIEQISNNGSPSYFFSDSNGSTRALLTSTGTIGATFTYTPFGALSTQTGTLTTPLRYGQGYTDPATGLIYLVNRYYDPATGQFMTIDPLASISHAPYGYSSNDPMNFSDPSGLLDGGDPLGAFATGWDEIKAAGSNLAAPIVCAFGGQCHAAVKQALSDDKQVIEDWVEGKIFQFPTLVLPKLNLPGFGGSSNVVADSTAAPRVILANASYITFTSHPIPICG
jgi:RHS repeat-associated protein